MGPSSSMLQEPPRRWSGQDVSPQGPHLHAGQGRHSVQGPQKKTLISLKPEQNTELSGQRKCLPYNINTIIIYTNEVIRSNLNFFFLDFFMWTIFKVFIEFVTILFLLYVFCFLAVKHVGS